MRRHKGYTMIEIIVVLALFSLLFSIVKPNFNLLSSTKERQELRVFKRDILYARNQAIVKGKQYYFKLNYDENGYMMYSSDGVEKRYKFQYGLSLVNNPEMIEIVFSRSGAPSKSGTISLRTHNNKKYYLSVTPVTGKITLSE